MEQTISIVFHVLSRILEYLILRQMNALVLMDIEVNQTMAYANNAMKIGLIHTNKIIIN